MDAHDLRRTIAGMIPVLMHVPDKYLEVFKAVLVQSLHSPAPAENVDQITQRKIALAARLVFSKKDEIIADDAERLAFLGARTVELLPLQRRVRMFKRKPRERRYGKQFRSELAEIYLRILGHTPQLLLSPGADARPGEIGNRVVFLGPLYEK